MEDDEDDGEDQSARWSCTGAGFRVGAGNPGAALEVPLGSTLHVSIVAAVTRILLSAALIQYMMLHICHANFNHGDVDGTGQQFLYLLATSQIRPLIMPTVASRLKSPPLRLSLSCFDDSVHSLRYQSLETAKRLSR